MRMPFLLLPVLALAGCLFDTRVAGGAEDFPNTIATLGVTVSDNLSSNSEWDQFSNIPTVDLREADSLVTGPQAKASAPLAKASTGTYGSAGAALPAGNLAAEDTAWNLADTLTLGIGRRFLRSESALRIKTDTAVFRWDDKARDTISGNELILDSRGVEVWKLSARLNAYHYENTDSAGGFDRATFHERLPRGGGINLHKLIVVKPGPDGDFAAQADNRPVYYASMRTLGTDTLDAFDVTDADRDGQLWGDNDSGLVDVRKLQTEPVLRPSVARFTQKMRAVFFKQSFRTYPVAYSETRADKDGKTVSFSVKGTRADSAFGPGDTVTVVVHTTASPTSDHRVAEKASRFKIRLADAPFQFSRNQLLEFIMETRWRQGAFRKGIVTATRLTFTPDEPVLSGSLDIKGSVKVEAEFADSTTGSASGRFENKQIRMDLDEIKAGVKLRRFRVLWDASGTVLDQEKLPN